MVLAEPLDDEAVGWLERRVRIVKAEPGDRRGDLEAIGEAAGLVVRTYTRVDEGLLDAAPILRVVGRAGVGLENVDLDACRRRGVRVVYTPDASTQAVVEYVFGVILDVVRPRTVLSGPVGADEFHRLRRVEVGRELGGRTLGVLGMGRIGRRVARAGVALGMEVLWNDFLDRKELGLPTRGIGRQVTKEELWGCSDMLTLHVDGRPENHGLIDESVLARLRPSCVLVNAARGVLVDAPALRNWATRVADSGGTAVLDVHDPEPPPPDYTLWNLPNVRLLPHLAARTERALRNMSWVVRDVVRVLEGRKPRFPAV